MSTTEPPPPAARETRRVLDITGPATLLLLAARPGDEVATSGGLIAEACARGRPPFVAILGDGAPDGSAARARDCERASRAATALLGLPPGRLLFVGVRQGAFPGAGDPVFAALAAAMAMLSWRQDCNVVAAPLAAAGDADGMATWAVAGAVAAREGLPLVVCAAQAMPEGLRDARAWRLDIAAWKTPKARALALHGIQQDGRDPAWEMFLRTA